MNTKKVLFDLLRKAIGETRVITVPSDADYYALYRMSVAHDLAHLIWYALQEKRNAVPEEVAKEFRKQHLLSVYREIKRSVAIEEIRSVFETEHIPFILLKGAVIASLYPEKWMRTSCDVDVLVRENDLSKAITVCQKNGMTIMGETPHDVSLENRDRVHVEIHHTLIEESRNKQAFGLLKNVWNHAEPVVESKAEYVLSDEMFYYYHVAHLSKHFINGGCGVRGILDLWLLNHRISSNRTAREKLLSDGGLLTFEEQIRRLSEEWFSQTESDPQLADLERFILIGGIYGNEEQGVTIRKKKAKNRSGYYWKRLFVPYENMKHSYPVLKKAPVLLPACWVARWLKMLDPKTRDRIRREMEIERSVGDAEISQMTHLMERLGL